MNTGRKSDSRKKEDVITKGGKTKQGKKREDEEGKSLQEILSNVKNGVTEKTPVVLN